MLDIDLEVRAFLSGSLSKPDHWAVARRRRELHEDVTKCRNEDPSQQKVEIEGK
jgi:hypothetical protein